MFYLLTPLKLDAPEWKRSTFRGPVQVEATSEADARARAVEHFTVATQVQRGESIVFDPWAMPEVVAAKLIVKPDPSVRLIGINDEIA